ncbi:MAG: PLP-dependent aminotransferase family protein [Limnochordales bacterium]|nr:PLP-dependent aminotransferase family protein [Limnochordales bacterium]
MSVTITTRPAIPGGDAHQSSQYEGFFSLAARSMRSSDIRDMFALTEAGDIISFAGGFPTPDVFPAEKAAALMAKVAATRPQAALQYGPTEGIGELRAAVADLMGQRGVPATPGEILLTAGSQQALDLVARTFADPLAPVLVELPGYVGGLNAIAANRGRLIGCPTDQDGIIPAGVSEIIERLRSQGEQPRFLYVIPNFNNPAGTLLPQERREALVEIARRYNLLIVEDDAYGELYYDRRPPLPLRALAPERVIYLGSFSKVFFPGLRVGWINGPEPLLRKLAVAKQAADLCSSTFGQYVVLEWLREGNWQQHTSWLRGIYRHRRDLMWEALRHFFPADARYSVPAGGFFFWVTVPDLPCSTRELLPQALAHGVAYVAGTGFCVDGGGQQSLRLSFSQVEEAKITEGIRRLGEFLAGVRERPPKG